MSQTNGHALKYGEFAYTRPTISEFTARYEELHKKFDSAASGEEAVQVLREWNDARIDYKTNAGLISTKFSQNVKDEWVKNEKEYLDEIYPTISELKNNFVKKVIDSPYRDDIEKNWGDVLIIRLKESISTFNPEIKPFLIEQAHLVKEYEEIIALAEIEVNGETHNLSSLGKLLTSTDRDTRLKAQQAKYGYLEKNGKQIDEIYDKLVKVRHKMALALGYENYTAMRYIELGRSEYTAKEVEHFRNTIYTKLVPFLTELYEDQRKRLGVEKLYFHDESLMFPEGNPTAQGSPDWIVERAKEMYAELSPETDVFFRMMIDRDLMDLVTRPNKTVGGYCTNFPRYGVPFIFSNFNGTTHDVEVLTHEAGHAFQVWESRHHTTPEYYFPTLEACEIHSMGMEYLTWKWMDKFFEKQTNRFYYYHLVKSLMFMAYGCAVDEFQHWVFENVEATPQQRNDKWSELEKKYLPWRAYQDMPYMEKGTMWQFQKHIFGMPFYYIDYVLAQTCALQFWARSRKDWDTAIKDYIAICRVGGSQTFLNIVKTGNLISPFDEKSLETLTAEAQEWLSTWRDDWNNEKQ